MVHVTLYMYEVSLTFKLCNIKIARISTHFPHRFCVENLWFTAYFRTTDRLAQKTILREVNRHSVDRSEHVPAVYSRNKRALIFFHFYYPRNSPLSFRLLSKLATGCGIIDLWWNRHFGLPLPLFNVLINNASTGFHHRYLKTSMVPS